MKQYIIDAFTDRIFAGNPAAVCIMDRWLSDDMMQNIAIENNLFGNRFCSKGKGARSSALVYARRRSETLRTCNAGGGLCHYKVYRSRLRQNMF